MSGLQLSKEEKDTLKFLMKTSINNPNYELEGIILGNASGNDINGDIFKRVIGRLNGKFEEQREIERLDIGFPRDSKYSSIRVSIRGFHDINKYCRNEKLDGLRNVIIEEKKPASERVNRLNIPDYNLRFNMKQENIINKDTLIIRDLMNPVKWRDIPKVYRYKKIYQYITKEGFSIDCSIVRSSQKNNSKMTVAEILKHNMTKNIIKPIDVSETFSKWWNKVKEDQNSEVLVKNSYTFFKSIKESHVFENTMTYEIETEFIGNTPDNLKIFNTLDANKQLLYIRDKLITLFRYISILLQAIQNSFYIISNTKSLELKKSYLSMLKSDNPSLFIGALPVDLQHINCIQVPSSLREQITEPNIIYDYAVCEKIDGERALLYIAKDGECYLINRNADNIFRKMGMNLGAKFANSLFDGEYLERDLEDNYINKLVIFDCYVAHGKLMIDNVFGDSKTATTSENTRNFHIQHLRQYYGSDNEDGTGSEEIKVENGLTGYAFKLDFINYLYGDKTGKKTINEGQLIFEKSSSLLNKMNVKYGGMLEEGHLFSYPTDGLIFIPTNRPLYNFQICKPGEERNAMLCNRKVSSYFKWKHNKKLTIDFRINFAKDNHNQRIIHFENGMKYAEVMLRCRNYDSFIYNKSGKNIINSSISSYLINENRNLYKEKDEVLFMSVQPYQGVRQVSGEVVNTLYIAYIPVSSNGDVCCINGDIIYDNNVIEFGYSMNEDINPFKRWIPERVRYGKVPNALNTAIDIWKMIHYSLTKENIINGLTINDMYNLANKYHLQLSKKTNLQSFIDHSKKYLLDKFLNGMTQPKIADFGCGNMDYFLKYITHNPSIVLGIDHNIDTLNNKRNGAGTLLLNYSAMSPKVRKTLERVILVDADLTKSLNTGESGDHSVLSSYYLDILYGRYKPEYTENGKLNTLYNNASSGFNLITAFNILEELNVLDDSIDMFIQNVASNLRDQGYFIGLMLDGQQIEKLLDTKLKVISGDNMTWLIERDEDNSAVIDVYYNYYNTIKKNYIINFTDIVSKCAEYGLRLIDSKSLFEDLGEFKSSYKKDFTDIEKDNEANGWLAMHRYFVFQKGESK